MENYLETHAKELVPVGAFLRKCLVILNIQQKRFAEYIGVRSSNLNKMLKGERPISHEMAIILEISLELKLLCGLKCRQKIN